MTFVRGGPACRAYSVSEITERGVLSESADSDEEFIECVGAASDLNFSVDDIVFALNPDFEE